jgi:hypothetical protein
MNPRRTAFSLTYDRRLIELQAAMNNLEDQLNEVSAQISKVGTELTGKIVELEGQLREASIREGEPVPARAWELIAEIKTKLSALDAVVPDAAAAPASAPAPAPASDPTPAADPAA